MQYLSPDRVPPLWASSVRKGKRQIEKSLTLLMMTAIFIKQGFLHDFEPALKPCTSSQLKSQIRSCPQFIPLLLIGWVIIHNQNGGYSKE